MNTILSKSVITLILSVLLFSSCTIEKRRYSSGYHVDWHNNKDHSKKRSKIKTPTPRENSTTMALGDRINTASADSSTTSIKSTQTPILLATETENTKTKLGIIVADTSLDHNNDLPEIITMDTLNYVPSIRESTTAVHYKNSHQSSTQPQNIGKKQLLFKLNHNIRLNPPLPLFLFHDITNFKYKNAVRIPRNESQQGKNHTLSIVVFALSLTFLVAGIIMILSGGGAGLGATLLVAGIGLILILLGLFLPLIGINNLTK